MKYKKSQIKKIVWVTQFQLGEITNDKYDDDDDDDDDDDHRHDDDNALMIALQIESNKLSSLFWFRLILISSLCFIMISSSSNLSRTYYQ